MTSLLHFPVIDSTNAYAKAHIDELESGTVILADQQTSGRGRLGRQWISPVGNLYCSLVYKDQTCDVSLFPLLCAISVSNALKRLLDLDVSIKWPNDLVVGQKKLCGILCESVVFFSQIHIICGIGINVNTLERDFSELELPYATSYRILSGKSCDLVALAETIAEEMEITLKEFTTKGFGKLRQSYENRLINRGKTVKVLYQKEEITALCLGIAENGNLLCRKEDGTEFTVNSGEASVRGLYGYV